MKCTVRPPFFTFHVLRFEYEPPYAGNWNSQQSFPVFPSLFYSVFYSEIPSSVFLLKAPINRTFISITSLVASTLYNKTVKSCWNARFSVGTRCYSAREWEHSLSLARWVTERILHNLAYTATETLNEP
jgi:hypothetical protein